LLGAAAKVFSPNNYYECMKFSLYGPDIYVLMSGLTDADSCEKKV